MTAADSNREVATPVAWAATEVALSPASRLAKLGRDLRRSYLQLFGIPDYERYVAHHQKHHPQEPLLSPRQFHARAIDRKYCHRGARCC